MNIAFNLLLTRFHSGPVNEQSNTGFRIVWTAVRPPRDVEDQDGNTIGKLRPPLNYI